MAKTTEVLTGKGVLWHGRKKIKAGDPIPADLSEEVHKSLKANGRIQEVVASRTTASAQLVTFKTANADAEKAEAAVKVLNIEALTKAVQTAKGLRTKAAKAANADKDNTELAVKADEAVAAIVAAETELTDAGTLAETAVRLRLEADILANG